MNRTSTTWILILYIFVSGPVASAARPLTVEDAGTADRGLLEVETAVEVQRDGRTTNLSTPFALTYGLRENFEVGLGFGGQVEWRRERGEPRDRVEGPLDTVVSVKWMLREQAETLPALSLMPAVKIPTAPESKGLGTGDWEPGLLLIGTWELERICFDANVGYTFVEWFRGSLAEGELFLGLAARYAVTDRLWLVGEVFGTAPRANLNRSGGGCSIGVQYEASSLLIFDAAIGTGIAGDGPDLRATVGLTWLLR
jgi:hypothetical protein